MMHPKFERLRMLNAALQAAAYALEDPIDRLEVRGDRVLVWAAGKQVILRYGYADSYDEHGSVMLGGGHWSAHVETKNDEGGSGNHRPKGRKPGVLKRLFSSRP